MKYHILKNPSPGTLAEIKEVSDETPAPDAPWVEMSAAEWLAYQSAHVAVPQAVTPRQIRRALTQAGLRAAVEAAVAAGSQDVRDDWEFSLEIRRDHPLLNAMAAGLGLTPAQLDDLFRLADTIP